VLLVGLTGGIGAGKSTVSELLTRKGAVLVDADEVARAVVEPGQPAFDALVDRFGREIVAADGTLDRSALARLAFADQQSHEDLESITHPAINTEFTRRVAEAGPDRIVVLDIPLLFESDKARARPYEVVIVVEAPRDARLARLEARGVAREDAERRMAAQASDDDRRTIATYVIDNAGDRGDLERQVDEVWADLERRHRAKE
jgi:dephospho-CoA kinase